MRPLAFLLVAACPAPEPSLALGTGETEFVDLDDTGGWFTLVHGPQGGFHVLVSLRATGLDTRHLVVATLTGTIGGEERARVEPWLSLDRVDGFEETYGAFLIYDAVPEELHDQATHVEATVRDIDGVEVSAAVDARIWDPALAGGEGPPD